MYTIIFTLFTRNEYKAKWLCRIKCILDSCGLSYIWDNQTTIDTATCKKIIHKQIEDIALQQWYTSVSSSSMCATYRLFKKQLNFEKYLLMSNNSNRISLTKFRCSNSKMPVHNQIYMFDTDKCTLCDLNVVGDEYHYLLICPYFTKSRENHMKKLFLW